MAYEWDWSAVWSNWPLLAEDVQITILATIACMFASVILALPLAFARMSRLWLAVPAQVYIELFRNMPLLVLVFWVFTAFPLLTGLTLSPFLSGVAALTLNLTAYISEIYRAGISSISQGQTHAALALGMTRLQLLRRIVLPQALVRVTPALGSMWVSLFKDTAILSVIGVGELMYEGRLIATDTYRPLEVFTAVAVIYYILAYPQSLGVNYLYRKFQVHE